MAVVAALAVTPGAVAKPEAGVTVIDGATAFDRTGSMPRVATAYVTADGARVAD